MTLPHLFLTVQVVWCVSHILFKFTVWIMNLTFPSNQSIFATTYVFTFNEWGYISNFTKIGVYSKKDTKKSNVPLSMLHIFIN